MMTIIKIYLLSVLFWFLLIEITGLIFKKRFIKNTDVIRIITDEKGPRMGNLKSTLLYLKIAFIPFLRLKVFIIKMVLTFYPKIIIELIWEEMNKNGINS